MRTIALLTVLAVLLAWPASAQLPTVNESTLTNESDTLNSSSLLNESTNTTSSCPVASDPDAVSLAGEAYLKVTLVTPVQWSYTAVWYETNGWSGLQTSPTWCEYGEDPIPADTEGIGYTGPPML